MALVGGNTLCVSGSDIGNDKSFVNINYHNRFDTQFLKL